MKQLYSESARRALEFARDEALRLKGDYIGSEHILLGLIKGAEPTFFHVLWNLGVNLEDLKEEISEKVTRPSGTTTSASSMPITSRTKKILIFAEEEAEKLGSAETKPEHLLLGILRDEECLVALILSSHGATYENALMALEVEKPLATQETIEFPLTPLATNILKSAQAKADRTYNSVVSTVHILFGMIDVSCGISEYFKDKKIDLEKLRLDVESVLLTDPALVPMINLDLENMKVRLVRNKRTSVSAPIGEGVRNILICAWQEACNRDKQDISPIDLLLALLKYRKGKACKILEKHGISYVETATDHKLEPFASQLS